MANHENEQTQVTNDISALELELEMAKKAAEDNLNLAKYHKAELDNFRKRNAEVSQKAYADGRETVIVQILPLMDALGEALKTVETEHDRQGIEILIRKFGAALISFGVEVIDTTDVSFDPRMHNAVAVETRKGVKPDMVIEEWQRGYTLNGRVIRPATVKVSS